MNAFYERNKGNEYSCSYNAQCCYEDNILPKSRWSKKLMISVIYDFIDEQDLKPKIDFEKIKKDDLFNEFFEWDSWHHVGKFANEVDFYKLDEDAILENCEKLTEEEKKQKDLEKDRARELRIREGELKEMKKSVLKVIGENFVINGLEAFERYPELFEKRTSLKGNLIVKLKNECDVPKYLEKFIFSDISLKGKEFNINHLHRIHFHTVYKCWVWGVYFGIY
ncbi:MAG: hypothetical protein HUJ74_00330 [Lachnospiraceae bacterium]|nr:hypothetical protein [Lachnospiraceae bacterium]